MENNVVSLKTAQKLKTAGFPQETERYWRVFFNELGEECRSLDYAGHSLSDCYAAPTAQEIVNQLPTGSSFQLYSQGDEEAGYDGKPLYAVDCSDESGMGRTMAEALASLYLKLHEAKS